MEYVVGAALVRDGGILLLRRQGQRQWTLPGSAFQPGEVASQALCRLLRQDFNLELTDDLRPTVTILGQGLPGWENISLSCYLVEGLLSTFQMHLSHQELRFVSPSALFGYELTDVDRRALNFLQRNGYLVERREMVA